MPYHSLIIPVENQVRELDAKLLLAYIAAQFGFSSYIGYRTEIDIQITRFPKSIYLSKSMTARSDKMFRIIKQLGHILCAWDEEALVHYPENIYFTRRLSTNALAQLDLLFSWGEDNTRLFKSYADFPTELPIVETGNPRLDLLRPELRALYYEEVVKLNQKFADFVLINTNFGNVNAYLPHLNLFENQDAKGNYLDIGRGAVGMPREYAEGRAQYKQAVLNGFLSLIPRIAEYFPNTTFIIRPHPVESRDLYNQLATQHKNVIIKQEGSVIPWILASRTVIHNGCTTGIEATLLGRRAIAYEPVAVDERYAGELILPNLVSDIGCSDHEVIALLTEKLDIECSESNNDAKMKYLTPYIGKQSTLLDSERIMQALTPFNEKHSEKTSTANYLSGYFKASKRRGVKRIKGLHSKSKYHRNFQQHRFPDLNEDALQKKLDIYGELLQKPIRPTIRAIHPLIFRVE